MPPALVSLPRVLGVGFGLKERGGALTATPAWRLYVRRKLPARLLPAAELVPPLVDGVPTDVVEKSQTRAGSGPPGSVPAGGAAIANARGVPGTLGCVAVTAHDGRPVLLSNHHVLFGGGAGEREPVWGRGGGAADGFRRLGSTLCGRIGTISFGGAECHVDCAIASLDGEAGLPPEWLALPAPHHVAEAAAGLRVTKTGGATGVSAGMVVDAAYPDVARMEGRTRAAPRQILVRSAEDGAPFSAPGDSGAVLRDGAGRLVGLLWGVNARGESVACPIAPVLWVLGIHPARLAAPPAPRRRSGAPAGARFPVPGANAAGGAEELFPRLGTLPS